MAVPTIAFATPPPDWPAGTGLFVKNAQSIDDAPFTTRSPRMTTRASTAIRDSTMTSAVIARLTSWRRNARPLTARYSRRAYRGPRTR